jgi:hypothetical protein
MEKVPVAAAKALAKALLIANKRTLAHDLLAAVLAYEAATTKAREAIALIAAQALMECGEEKKIVKAATRVSAGMKSPAKGGELETVPMFTDEEEAEMQTKGRK